MFATVTFYYSKITKVVPLKWIIDFEKSKEKFNKIFFCFWSRDLTKDPLFDMQLYTQVFREEKDGILKVLIGKVVGK